MNPGLRRRFALLLTVILLLAGAGMWQRQSTLDGDLIEAMERYDNGRARTLLEAGANPNTCVPGKPAVAELVDQLRHHHRMPEFVDRATSTAFMMACGAEWTDETGKTKWHRVGPDDADLIQLMIRHGAAVNATQSGHRTALLAAVKYDRPRTVDVLLRNGANVDEQDNQGFTALYWNVAQVAVGQGNLNILRLLLASGADPNRVDQRGVTPLLIAQQYKRPDIVALLVKHKSTRSSLIPTPTDKSRPKPKF